MEIQLSKTAREWQRIARQYADEYLQPHEVEAELNDGELPPELIESLPPHLLQRLYPELAEGSPPEFNQTTLGRQQTQQARHDGLGCVERARYMINESKKTVVGSPPRAVGEKPLKRFETKLSLAFVNSMTDLSDSSLASRITRP